MSLICSLKDRIHTLRGAKIQISSISSVRNTKKCLPLLERVCLYGKVTRHISPTEKVFQTPYMGLLIVYIILCLSISCMCSVLEAVLLSTTVSFAAQKEEEGHRIAGVLKKYKADIDRPIAAILSLNTVANTMGAAAVGAQAAQVFGSHIVGYVSAALTIGILVFSEIIPKTIGSTYWRNLALGATRIIRVLIVITFPMVWISERITSLIGHDKAPLAVSREEVSAMVNVGVEEGVFEAKERKIIQSFLKLDELHAEDIMTPSTVVASAIETMTLREFYEADDEEFHSYSRIPVYDAEEEYIKGYVLRAEVLDNLSDDKFKLRLADLIRPILTFQESESVSNIWEKMLQKKEHISVIVDEYGSMRGIVTMEDVIETMLGVEIVDESDEAVNMQDMAREKWEQQQRHQEGFNA